MSDIDAALREVRRDEPVIETVEKGLQAAKTAGVPVDLDGAAQKPPASALAVVRTGFGPDAVPAAKPVAPPKPVPAVSPAAKAAAPAKRSTGGGTGAARKSGPAPGAAAASLAAPVAADSAVAVTTPAASSPDKLLAPPVPPPGVRPTGDPAFTHVTNAVKGIAAAKRAHPAAASKAKEAQDAALPPADDLAGQAKAAKVDTMDAQQPGAFDRQAFIAAVKAAIEAKSPKTLEEADEYKQSGKAGEVKGEVKGLVTTGKEGQARDIETATDAPPDQSKAVAKPVTPLAAEQPGAAPAVAAAGAAPKPAPPEQTNLAAGPAEANQEMAQGEVTEQQLAQSNEPQFQGALADKQAAAAHAQTAPAQFRQQEQQVVTQHKADASAQATAGVAGMQSSKGAALAALVAAKGATKTKDEAKRAEVTTKIQGIFAATEKDVKAILDGLDPKVDKAFTEGEAAARQAFEAFVDAKMRAYKKDRYGGWLGGLRWAKDKLFGMPDKVNEFYAAGRELYLKQMNGVITRVADIVGGDLTKAKQRIAAGRIEIATYVKSLPADLQKVGSEASKEIGDKFAQLESDVDAKQEAMVDALATKYTEARKGLDERIEALQAENKGLVDKAIGAIKAVINTIRELAAMLKNVLARAAGVVGDIIKNPIGFLDNLIAGVKGGILKFKDNILDHLRKGLMSWLFGALAEAGVELPDKFDLMGIVKLLASLFGLTWTNIRNRLVRQIGEKAMGAVEKGVEIFSLLRTQGVAGLWQMLVDKLGDIKEMILEQVKDFVITKIITAGITWLIGLLNPAAAFIKACKMIYDVVMFFVDNGSRILKFVNTVIDSVADIVKGNVSGVVNKINDVLGQMVPIIIGFLASLVGLGGIGQKIRSIIETLQKPVTKALDFVIKTGLKLAGPIIRGIKGISGKVKAKVAAGKAWVKGKAEAGKKWVKGKAAAAGSFLKSTCDRLLGFAFNTPFSADGKPHRLFTEPGSPDELYVASQPTRLVAAFSHLKPASLKSRIIELDGQFRYRMREYRARIKALQDRGEVWAQQNPSAVHGEERSIAAVREQARTVQGEIAQFAKDNLKAGQGAGTHAPGIANLAPYGSQLRSLHDSVPEWKMTAEHIVPDGLLRATLMALTRIGRRTKADTRYHDQPTITIYHAAGAGKTGGVPWNATRGGDQDLIIRMRNVVGMVRTQAGGEYQGLRKPASGDPPEGLTPKRYWRVYLKDQFERRVGPLFASLAEKALGRTKAAVKAEQAEVGDRRGVNAQTRPNDSELDAAYSAQKAHMDVVLAQYREEADFD
ncbi:phage tail protein [Pseudonocardia charpentierae]|uniref:Phage-related protein n=1 Tax=Pseudonocardia charpentierae TaxID=3075545 RepID=A0ABU2N5E6_9PSEU|nr:hypothetical protein [Pseudonocardia sp. DSM 45834]MDT0348946.1 hypothetical protein [Pseudonocardia sp. DSM 45834]